MDTPTSPRKPSRIKRWHSVLLAVLAFIVAAGATLYAKSEQIVLGAEAYIFGYPLVVMDVTRAHSALTVGPENQLRRVRVFPDASFKGVVRPNVDTLYTSAFIDMAQGPWVFEMSANDQRYEVMPFMDAWTNVFAAPGTRLSGKAGGKFLLAGPNWTGIAPDGMQLLRSPTRIVWLIGRTQTNGVTDYPVVHRLQDGLSLQRWNAGVIGSQTPAPAAAIRPQAKNPTPPAQIMQEMDTNTFFTQLAALMVDNPPTDADQPMLMKLQRIGIAPGQPPQWGLLDRWSVALGRWIADFKVAQELKKPRELVRGWSTPPMILGQYGTSYNIRAVVAMVGLGANLPADATYPQAQVDSQGNTLNGSKRYRLSFKAGELPPVKAFWSVTAYGADDFLIENPIKRYALGDRDPLVFNADGSLDLWIQADEPEAGKKSNWLPVKAGERFLLNARLYWPREAALNGSWGMPAVERIQ
ncbi:MAG: DUF1254 domain-containing protein [Burkholderiales bacterium]|nr:MAG: DUF1254 domain-containing protein [Burkholderiales bacterium]